MAATTRRLHGTWPRLLMAIAASVVAMAAWIVWAAKVSGMSANNAAFVCAKRPEFTGQDAGTITEARWEWFPPGLRCSADYGDIAGERRFFEPSWVDVAIPTLLLLAVLAWLVVATVGVVRAAASACPAAKLTGGGALIVAAEVIAVLSVPVSFDAVGLLLIVWVPLALLLAAGLLFAARMLLRPAREAEKPLVSAGGSGLA